MVRLTTACVPPCIGTFGLPSTLPLKSDGQSLERFAMSLMPKGHIRYHRFADITPSPPGSTTRLIGRGAKGDRAKY